MSNAAPSERHIALQKDIDELKKSRRLIEKDACKAINKVLKSAETPEKIRSERHRLKKEMKEALVTSKKTLREKKKEIASA